MEFEKVEKIIGKGENAAYLIFRKVKSQDCVVKS